MAVECDREWGDRQIDALFDLLADPTRRQIVSFLARRDRPVDVEEIVDHLVGTDPERRRERVHIALHHAHLPKLADLDLLDVDTEDGTVRSTRRLERAARQFVDARDVTGTAASDA